MNLKVSTQRAPRTLVEFGLNRLSALGKALGFAARERELAQLFRRLGETWADQPLGQGMGWESHVVDDGTPFEFSVAYGGDGAELRIMVEPFGAAPSLESNAQAAIELLRDLSKDYDITLDRFEKVRDLFLPEKPRGPFSIWVAACFEGTRPPDFKIYLCPEARGARHAAAVLEEALVRLGFSGAWGVAGKHLGARGPELDQFKYFSLDLGKTPEARVKVYARHQASTPEDLEAAASASPTHRPGEVKRFLKAVAPGLQKFRGRAPFTCYSFVEGRGDSPSAVTTHFPINGYARNDLEVSESALATLEHLGISAGGYLRTLDVIATRPLEDGVGLQSYLSFRRHKDKPRLTVYLPCEAFRPGTIAASGAAPAPSGVMEIVDRYEQDGDMTTHPFIRRLSREAFSRSNIWLLLANLEIAEAGAARRVAQIAARVQSDALRSPVVALLNEQLGDGQFERARVRGFGELMAHLESWRPAHVDDWSLLPGRRLDARLAEVCGAQDTYVGAGALLAGEVFRKQLGVFLDEQIARDEVPRDTALPWRRVGSRPQPAESLASSAPEEALEALWQGASARRQAEWTFFDHMYAVCYALEQWPVARVAL